MKTGFILVLSISIGGLFAEAGDFDRSREIDCVVTGDGYPEIRNFTLLPAAEDGSRSLRIAGGKLFPNACIEVVDRIRCQTFRDLIEYRLDFPSRNLNTQGKETKSDLLVKKTFAPGSGGSCVQTGE